MAALLVAGLSANAQGFRWGVQAGMNVSNIHVSEGSTPDSRVGFHVGLKADYTIIKGLYVNGALMFTQKGYKGDKVTLNGKDYTAKAYPGYIELPIHLGYKYTIFDGFAIFGEAGPYFAYGVCGKYKMGDNKTDYFGDDSNNKNFDAGIGVKAGMEFANAFQIGLGYDWGLTKVNDDSSDFKEKNRNFMLSFAYMF